MRLFNIGKLSKLGLVALLTVITTVSIVSLQREDLTASYAISAGNDAENDGNNAFHDFRHEENTKGKWRQLTDDQVAKLSKLGRILYLQEDVPTANNGKNYKILVWKYGRTTDDRHFKRYGKERHDPFEFCSTRNCKVTYDDNQLRSADLVIVHLHRTTSSEDIPPQQNRSSKQIWAFSTDESPHHTFLNGKSKLAQFNNVFNWSMTYRMDSDIPVPYGRTVLREKPNEDYNFSVYSWLLTKRHDVLVTIMGSNCGSKNHRWEYVKELEKHIPVDVYGSCGKLKCAGHFNRDCPEISQYMFYLAFENSNCDEYVTEKVWWNAFSKGAVPVVMGAPKSAYAALLPPRSYIDAEDFATPRDLATYLLYLANSPTELQRYFRWRKYYKVLNEHGYFQSASYHYCRACEALNYNEKNRKVYNDLARFWDVKSDCYPAWDEQ